MNYIVATLKPWNVDAFHKYSQKLDGNWYLINKKTDLNITKTKLSALKMTSSIDAGPIYLKSPLLLHGRAQDIYNRMSVLTWKMISKIIQNEIKPKPQNGKIFNFKRKTPSESEITSELTLKQIHDKIRMLDAETYPKAFINKNELKLEFFESNFEKNEIIAKVKITKQINKVNK